MQTATAQEWSVQGIELRSSGAFTYRAILPAPEICFLIKYKSDKLVLTNSPIKKIVNHLKLTSAPNNTHITVENQDI